MRDQIEADGWIQIKHSRMLGPLAVGLLAVLAQMPMLFSFIDESQHREKLREMTLAAIEPILGLHQVIQNYYTDMRARGMGGGGD